MRVWTVHAGPAGSVPAAGGAPRKGRAPVLVPEAFAGGALLLPTLWFLSHCMWIVAVIWTALWVLAAALLPDLALAPALVGLHLLAGLFGQDLRRWSLARRGLGLVGVVAAADEDRAWARVAGRRPDLARAALLP